MNNNTGKYLQKTSEGTEGRKQKTTTTTTKEKKSTVRWKRVKARTLSHRNKQKIHHRSAEKKILEGKSWYQREGQNRKKITDKKKMLHQSRERGRRENIKGKSCVRKERQGRYEVERK